MSNNNYQKMLGAVKGLIAEKGWIVLNPDKPLAVGENQIPAFVCTNYEHNEYSIVTSSLQESVNNWGNPKENPHKQIYLAAENVINDYIKDNNIDTTQKDFKTRCHHFDIIKKGNKGLVRMHLDMQAQMSADKEIENFCNNNLEKRLEEIVSGKNLDGHLKFAIDLQDKLDYSTASQILKVMKEYLELANYSDINEWIAKNPDKCALPENRKNINSDNAKSSIKDSIQPDKASTKSAPTKDAR